MARKRGLLRPGCRALCFLVIWGLATPVLAAIVENLTMGNAKALALGNAVTADPPGIDSIHYNPAGLAAVKGRKYNLKVLAAVMNFEVEFGGHDAKTQKMLDDFGYTDEVENQTSSTSTIGLRLPFVEGITEWPLPVLVLPLGGASYQPMGSDVTFATAVYAPMAAGYVREENDPATFMGEYLSLAKITYFSPTVGIRVSDSLSVGVGINLSWQGATAGTRIRVPNFAIAFGEMLTRQLQGQSLCPSPDDPSPAVNFCGLSQDIANMGPYTDAAYLEFDAETALVVGYNFGLLWHPTPWFTWGFVYQPESTAKLDGTYRVDYGDEWVNFFGGVYQSDVGKALDALLPWPTGLVAEGGLEEGKAKLDIITPAHFATGISLQVTPNWKINLDAKWTDWAAWEGLTIRFDKELDFTKLATNVSKYSTPDSVTFPRGYESIWNWALGIEYQYSDRLALRFGYEPRKSSIPTDKQDVLLPLGDAELYGFGFSYHLAHDELWELGFGYVHASADVPANASTNANSNDDWNNFIYNPYAGTDFKSNMNAYLVELSYTASF
ncbi:MAG: outer membrane protein transport protein [Pseudomonadales bacterium]|nr:outer membrane protein transport protein [Pseudomonadales bacterium]